MEAKICFQVDDVEQVNDPLSTIDAKSYLKEQHDRPLIAFSHDAEFQIVEQTGNHPLATAAHIAFS